MYFLFKLEMLCKKNCNKFKVNLKIIKIFNFSYQNTPLVILEDSNITLLILLEFKLMVNNFFLNVYFIL